jgi:hypothetical protein
MRVVQVTEHCVELFKKDFLKVLDEKNIESKKEIIIKGNNNILKKNY